MRVNSTLVLWNGGWIEVSDPAAIIDAGYRAEAFISLGSQHDQAEAVRQAEQILADYQVPRQQLEAAFDPPTAAERPYTTWRPGSLVTVAGVETRVHSLHVTKEDDGPTFKPTFGDAIPSAEQRTATTLKKMSGGTLGGEARIATPVSLAAAGRAGQPADTPAEIFGFTSGAAVITGGFDLTRTFSRSEATTWHVTVNLIAHMADPIDPSTVTAIITPFAIADFGPVPGGGGSCFWNGWPDMRLPLAEWGPGSPGYAHGSYTFVFSSLPGDVELGGSVGAVGAASAFAWVSVVAVPSTGETTQGWACGG